MSNNSTSIFCTGLRGFMGSPSVADTELPYYRLLTLIASSDLPSWIPRVWRQCGTDVCLVSWHRHFNIHLCHVCHKVVALLWAVALVVFWLRATCAWLGDWNLGRLPSLNSGGHDTGVWLGSEQYGDDHSTVHGHVLSRVVSRSLARYSKSTVLSLLNFCTRLK